MRDNNPAYQYLKPENVPEAQAIGEYFKNAPSETFVEVGANDPKVNSQTYALELQGWSGVLVEPLQSCVERLSKERPQSKVYHNAATAPEKEGVLTLHCGSEEWMASLQRSEENMVDYTHTEEVEARTLNSILEDAEVSKIDFLSIDVEGSELDVLHGLDLKKYQPRLILLEDNFHRRDKHRYLKQQGYKLVKRTMVNNWYIPRGAPRPKVSFKERLRLKRKSSPIWMALVRLKHKIRKFRHKYV